MITMCRIIPADVISQEELDDVAEINAMFAGNTRQHLVAQRNLRLEASGRQSQDVGLVQRLSINLHLD